MLDYIQNTEANKPQKFPLKSTDKQQYYLMVLNYYSDQYQHNKTKIQQAVAQSMFKGEYGAEEEAKYTAKMLACAVVDWKVPDEYGECTPENVEKFFIKYPSLRDQVDAFTSKDSYFIEKK